MFLSMIFSGRTRRKEAAIAELDCKIALIDQRIRFLGWQISAGEERLEKYRERKWDVLPSRQERYETSLAKLNDFKNRLAEQEAKREKYVQKRNKI